MASTELATAYISLVATTKGMRSQVAKELGGIERDAGRSGERSGGLMSRAMGGAISGVGKLAKGALVSGLAAAGAAGATAFAKGFGRLKAIEEAQAKLRGLGHSAKTVEKVMANANAAVKGTAFGLGDAATAAASALAAGIKPGQALENHLKLIGDAATIAGADFNEMGAIFGKVAAGGVIQGEEIAQLSDRGIPILQLLASELGVTALKAKKMASDGKVSFETFSAAMQKGMGGAALESGKTVQGAFNNLLASLGRVGANILKPLYDLLPGFLTWVTGALKPVERAATAAAAAVSGAFAGVGSWLSEGVGPALSGMFSGMGEGASVADRLRAAFDAIAASPFAQWVRDAVGDLAARLAPAFSTVADLVTSRLLPAIVDIARVVGPALATAAGAFVEFAAAVVGSPVFRFFAGVALSLVMGFVNGVVNAFVGIVKVITGVFDVIAGLLTGDWGRVWEGLKTVVFGAVQAVWGLINVWLIGRVFGALGGVVRGIGGLFGGLGGLIRGGIQAAIGVVRGFVTNLAATVSRIGAAIGPVVGAVGAVFAALAQAVVSAWSSITAATSAAIGWLTSTLGAISSSVGGAFTAAWQGMAGIVSAAWGAVSGAVSAGWAVVSGVFAVMRAVVVGQVVSSWHAFSGAVTGAWAAVTGAVASAWAVVSPILSTIADVVGRVLGGVFFGLQVVVAAALGAVILTVEALWGVAKRVFDGVVALLMVTVVPAWLALRDGVTAVWNWLLTRVFTPLYTWVTGTLVAAFTLYRNVCIAVWTAVRDAVIAAWTWLLTRVFTPLRDWVVNVLVAAFNLYRNACIAVWTAVRDAITTAWNWILTRIFTPLRDWVMNTLVAAFTYYRNLVTVVWNAVRAAIAAAWDWILNRVFNPIRTWLTATFTTALNNFRANMDRIWSFVTSTVTAAGQRIDRIFTALKDGVQSVWRWFQTAVAGIGRTWETLREKVAAPVRFVVNDIVRDKLVAAWNRVAGMVKLPTVNFAGFARGGYTGPGRKYDPAGVVHADEFVLRKEATSKIRRRRGGLRWLYALNRDPGTALSGNGFAGGGLAGGMPGYARGGLAKPWPTYVAALVRRLFPGIRSIGGYGSRPGPSDHGSGNALDFMVPDSGPLGDAISAWGIKNQAALNLKYIIWKKRIIGSSAGWGGWRPYTRYGNSPNRTLQHYDHPHFSFIHDRPGNPAALGMQLSAAEVAAALAGGGGGGGMMTNPLNTAAKNLMKPFFDGARSLVDSIGSRFNAGEWGNMVTAAGKMPIQWVQDFLNKTIDRVLPPLTWGNAGDDAEGDPAPGSGPVRSQVQAVASKYGWGSGSQWSALEWIIGRESSWNPTAQNPKSTAFGLFQFLNCVPLDAVILTQRGWLTHDEVAPGDQTIGFNPATGRNEWTTVRHVVHKPAQQVVTLRNHRWSATVTPGHRWWTLRRGPRAVQDAYQVCPECGATGAKRGAFGSPRSLRVHRAKLHGVDSRTVEYVDFAAFTETRALTTAHALVLSAQADTGNRLDITDNEARILGWLADDGSIRFPSDNAITMTLWQAKPHRVAEIRELLAGVPCTESARSRGEGHFEEHSWYFHASYAHDLANRSGLRGGFEAMVLAMSPSQRAAWLDGIASAEGAPVTSGDGEIMRIPQNDGDVAEAIMLAAYLAGFRPSRRTRSGQPGFSMITLARPEVHAAALTTSDAGVEDVWCVQTDLGTWTMRQGEHVSLTGNSTWAGTGIGKTSNAAQQAEAGMRYIRDRYGSPAGAQAFWRRNGYYADGGLVDRAPQLFDSGGVLWPGTHLVQNATGRPETVRTWEQEQALRAGLSGAQITINGIEHDSVGEFAQALDYAMVRARNVGRYNRVGV